MQKLQGGFSTWGRTMVLNPKRVWALKKVGHSPDF